MTNLNLPPLSILKRSALETGVLPVDFGIIDSVRRSFKLPWQPKPLPAGSGLGCQGSLKLRRTLSMIPKSTGSTPVSRALRFRIESGGRFRLVTV